MSPAMSSNALNMSGCITARSTAHVPPIDQPTMPQFARCGAHAVVRDHVRHNIFGEVVGGVAAAAVDAFGVVVECAAGVDEDQHRRIAADGRRRSRRRVLTALPVRSQSAGVLNSPPIIITVGSGGGGSVAYQAGGR